VNETPAAGRREGSLEAPRRHPLDWTAAKFWDSASLDAELARIFEICHGCRRCFSLCQAFPTLFDAIDGSASGELESVARPVYWQVVDHCYLCDLCYMTKCPYVPPHPWNVDFPHLMLRAKAVRYRSQGAALRDRILSATDTVGRIAGIPVVAEVVNAVNRTRLGRRALSAALGVHPEAPLPEYHARSFRASARRRSRPPLTPRPAGGTRGKVALFATCYCNRNAPDIAHDLVAVYEHNGIPVELAARERCCGMPKLELGDLESVKRLMQTNVPQLLALVDQGCDVVAPVPSCVLMFRQELPLMFPDDPQIARLKSRVFDPFEYLWLRHKAGELKLEFARPLGKIAYHVPCHLRVQNIGFKTRDVLALVPGTTLEVIERCSGHDGTYGVKTQFRESSVKIGRAVVARVKAAQADYYASDCPMAQEQIASGLTDHRPPTHPLTLLRLAYGLGSQS
jgi:glycerol-3-phosphate dehydrogenase subunit C